MTRCMTTGRGLRGFLPAILMALGVAGFGGALAAQGFLGEEPAAGSDESYPVEVTWSVEEDLGEGDPNALTLTVKAAITTREGWWIYGYRDQAGGYSTSWTVDGPPQITFEPGEPAASKASVEKRLEGIGSDFIWKDKVELSLPIRLEELKPGGIYSVIVELEHLACREGLCLDVTTFYARVTIGLEGEGSVTTTLQPLDEKRVAEIKEGWNAALEAEAAQPAGKEASFTSEEGQLEGKVEVVALPGGGSEVVVTVEVAEPWYVYSTGPVDPEDASYFTVLELAEGVEGIRLGALKANEEPKVVRHPEFSYLVHGKHAGKTVFRAPVYATTADVGSALDAALQLRFMICKDGLCLNPETVAFRLQVTPGDQPALAASFRSEGGLAPGAEGELVLTLPEGLSLSAADLEGASVVPLNTPIAVVPDQALRVLSDGRIAVPIQVGSLEEGAKEGELTLSGKLILSDGRSFPFSGKGLIYQSILAFLLVASLAGAFALLTPCVWPMIPITVSYFTKQAESTGTKPVKMAIIYCAGIIVSFTAVGALFTAVLGAAGPEQFATHPVTLGFIGVLFLVFAFSLFGWFNLQPPQKLMALAGKAQGTGGTFGILALGLLFAVTTFTCTAPFIGGLLGTAAVGGFFKPVLGMLAFSVVLAVPFFFLSIFPSRLKSLPKSGGWLNEVKVTMGFIELMAAFKFLGDMDAVQGWGIITRSVVLTVWTVSFIMLGFYLLGLIRMPHDSPRAAVPVPALLLAICSWMAALGMASGIDGSPIYPKVDSFLPREEPDRTPEAKARAQREAIAKEVARSLRSELGSLPAVAMAGDGPVGAAGSIPRPNGKHFEMEFENAYETARAEAIRQGKPLFIDFTGYACINCREMEKGVFVDSAVQSVVNEDFVVATLYTDGATSDPVKKAASLKARKVKDRLIDTVGQPYYVILDPKSEQILSQTSYQNRYISDPSTFASWLEQARDGYRALSR